ncbi:MAG: hypothetical protein WCO05_02260 [Candidatus Moraniibacteriota bacterium]|jgi:hypothetical protein
MFREFFEKSLIGKILEVVVLFAAIVMARYFQWEIANTVFFVLFVLLLLHPIPSRFAAFGVVFLLVVTAVLFLVKRNNWADICSIWAYYLMFFTAMLSFSQLQNDENGATIAKDK